MNGLFKVPSHRLFHLDWIYANYPSDYTRYHDLCAGSGALTYNHKHSVEYSVLNDWNYSIFACHWVCKYLPESLAKELSEIPFSYESWFMKKMFPRTTEKGKFEPSSFEVALNQFVARGMSTNGNMLTFSPKASTLWFQTIDNIINYSKMLQGVEVISERAISYLKNNNFTPDDLIVFDPPAWNPMPIGISKWDWFMTDQEHRDTLEIITQVDAKVIIIGRDNDLYNYYLQGWEKSTNSLVPPIKCRNSGTVECIWRNYHVV